MLIGGPAEGSAGEALCCRERPAKKNQKIRRAVCTMWVAILCLASAHASVLSAPAEPPLTPENINPRLVAAEYAVRGRLLDRAKELESVGRRTVKCNIGNPQALGQRPLSWVRQVLSLVLNADLLEAAEAAACGSSDGEALRALFPPDAVARARVYVDAISSAGAYSDSQGVLCVREEVAHFLRERDGCGSEARGQSCICTSAPSGTAVGQPCSAPLQEEGAASVTCVGRACPLAPAPRTTL